MINIEQKIKQTRVYFYLTVIVIAFSIGATALLMLSYSKLDGYAKNTIQNWDIHNHNVKKVENYIVSYYHDILKLPLYKAEVQSDLDSLLKYEREIEDSVKEMCKKEIFTATKEGNKQLDFDCKEFGNSIQVLKDTKNALINALRAGDDEISSWVHLIEWQYVEVNKFLNELTTYSKVTVEQTIQKTERETKKLFYSLVSLVVVAVLATALYLIFSTKSMRSIKILFKEVAKKNIELNGFNKNLEEKVEKRTKQLREANNELKILRDYDISQQKEAREKQEFVIVNDIIGDRGWSSRVVYKSSDILSGDGYSIFKNENGDVIYFLIDGQGHGLLPSLTVFAVASTISQNINVVHSLDGMVKYIIETLKVVLGDYEQLSYSIFWLHNKTQKIEYAIGGMYETFIKYDDRVEKVVSNNIPAMSFLKSITVSSVPMSGFRSILTYSDGLVEEKEPLDEYFPEKLIEDPSLIIGLNGYLKHFQASDDITLVYIEKEA